MFGRATAKNILAHIFFCSFFLVVPILALVRPPGQPFFTFNRVFVQDTTASFVLLCFFYLNYYIFIPTFFLTKKYVEYVLYIIIFLSFAFTLPFLAGKFFHGSVHELPPSFPREPNGMVQRQSGPPSIASFVFDEFRRHLYLFFTAVFFSFLLRTREHVSRLKEEKLEAELSSLKSQINPHFLFNTLNCIYTLSVKKDDKASEAIIQLSGLMRYVIKDAHNYKIPLQKEIEFISNYIELQKARLGNTANICFECSGEPDSMEIAPLILITYIENAFKYGINPDADDCIAEVILQITDVGIKLYTFNKKVQYSTLAESTGIGMNNTKERLEHLYPKRHTLQLSENEQTYSVTLTIKLV